MAKPHPQLLGQIPTERVTPGLVFEKLGSITQVLFTLSQDQHVDQS